MDGPTTGTFTFLFTDVEGSTRLWEREAAKMQAAPARHDGILKGTVKDHGAASSRWSATPATPLSPVPRTP